MTWRVAPPAPRIGSPATCSARLGTGPWADCKTTPCLHTQPLRPGWAGRGSSTSGASRRPR